jgi:hypothetical protein
LIIHIGAPSDLYPRSLLQLNETLELWVDIDGVHGIQQSIEEQDSRNTTVLTLTVERESTADPQYNRAARSLQRRTLSRLS